MLSLEEGGCMSTVKTGVGLSIRSPSARQCHEVEEEEEEEEEEDVITVALSNYGVCVPSVNYSLVGDASRDGVVVYDFCQQMTTL